MTGAGDLAKLRWSADRWARSFRDSSDLLDDFYDRLIAALEERIARLNHMGRAMDLQNAGFDVPRSQLDYGPTGPVKVRLPWPWWWTRLRRPAIPRASVVSHRPPWKFLRRTAEGGKY